MTRHAATFTAVAAILIAASWATASFAQPAALGRPTVLIHGNYCGPGNNAPLAPIDALDAACARHDACTPSTGLPAKACNLRLEREAEAIALDRRQTDELRALAGLVAAFAAANPSRTARKVVPGDVAAVAARIVSAAWR